VLYLNPSKLMNS